MKTYTEWLSIKQTHPLKKIIPDPVDAVEQLYAIISA